MMGFRDRLLFMLLTIGDKLFGAVWVQHELERRRARLAGYQSRVEAIQQETSQLESRMEALHVQLCMLYLRQRHMTHLENWLHFESGGDDEPGLDLVIEHLVKPRLAAIEMYQNSPDSYTYHLHPDWQAIAGAMGDSVKMMERETLVWLQQQTAGQGQPAKNQIME